MTECEDCGDDCGRRTRCPYCGLLICRWCYHHIHGREPSHTAEERLSVSMGRHSWLSAIPANVRAEGEGVSER